MKKVLLITLIFFSAQQCFSQQKLTLQQSLGLAFKNSKEIKISNSKVISSSAKVDEVKSQYMPQLRLSAN